MFKSLLGIVEDVATVALAPVSIAVDVTRTVTKPLADVANAAAKTVNEVTKDIQDELSS